MEISIRPTTTRAEEQASLAVYNAVWPLDAVTLDEVDSYKAAMRAHTDLVAWAGDEPVASGFGAIQPQRPDVAHAVVTVLPEHRRRGTGTALYRDLSQWAAEHGLSAIATLVYEDDAASLTFAERRGFVEVERNGRMILDLRAHEPAPITPPPGVQIVTWAERPELARGLYDVAVEAYADVPGAEDEEMEAFEDWLEHDMRGAGDSPDATFVALADGEVVGYAKFTLTAAQPRAALHDMTAVKRAWRGRGIAGALKRAEIAWAKDRGYERLVAGNEMRNEPIRRLNARLGYRPAPGRVLLRGPLAARRAT
jgi:GNAT superfamily N-acetyltransferase